jgi:hypothetical protein
MGGWRGGLKSKGDTVGLETPVRALDGGRAGRWFGRYERRARGARRGAGSRQVITKTGTCTAASLTKVNQCLCGGCTIVSILNPSKTYVYECSTHTKLSNYIFENIII